MIIVLLILLIGYIVVVSHDTWWGVSNGRGNTSDEIAGDQITSNQITNNIFANNLISGGAVVVKAPPNYQPYYHRVLDNLDREEYGKRSTEIRFYGLDAKDAGEGSSSYDGGGGQGGGGGEYRGLGFG